MEDQFKKLQYDISKPGLLIENYSDLADFKEFSNPDDDKYLKLAILISDEESPFVRKEKDYTKIVTKSCDYLSINDFDFIQCLILGGNNSDADKVRWFVHLLFVNRNNWSFQTWWTMCYSFHESSLVIRTPLNPADKDYEVKAVRKQAMLKQMQTIQKDLVSYENQIFPNAYVKQIVTQQTARMTNWAEKMAKERPQ